jgi:hypothetical protein
LSRGDFASARPSARPQGLSAGHAIFELGNDRSKIVPQTAWSRFPLRIS